MTYIGVLTSGTKRNLSPSPAPSKVTALKNKMTNTT